MEDNMAERNYWCYRINNDLADFFWNELMDNRLRQGWGWLKGQDLRNFKKDEGAGRNFPMFKLVKKGDILLVPHLPSWDEVAIVEATKDWDIGYKFEIDKELGDFGHIFPAKYIKKFIRSNKNVSGNIRSTLKNRLRFWNIDHYKKDVEKLLSIEVSELSESQDREMRLESSIRSVFKEVFNESEFSEKLYTKLNEQFTCEEWEFALVHGIKQIFPFYFVERVGGGNEKNHGTDILIKMPGIIPDYEYAIAIQVKDYEGFVADDVIKQINKAEKYWNDENIKLIEKIVIITRANKDDNINLIENKSGVKFVFAREFMQLLSNIGQTFIGITYNK
jgi:hypothetical protein